MKKKVPGELCCVQYIHYVMRVLTVRNREYVGMEASPLTWAISTEVNVHESTRADDAGR